MTYCLNNKCNINSLDNSNKLFNKAIQVKNISQLILCFTLFGNKWFMHYTLSFV